MCGILVCGPNGSGKTTFGAALSKALGFSFINDEDYYFLESEIPYSKSRTGEEAREYILNYIKEHDNFVITATRGNLGEQVNSHYNYVIYISAPLEIRLSRIKQRNIDKFGDRVLCGGDMYEQQNEFYNFVASRSAEKTEKWLDTLSCKVFRLDGTKPVEYNVKLVVSQINNYK